MKQRVFNQNDQTAFAELSGDANPLHTDAIAARRMLFGAPVVHGVHLLLWALDGVLEGRDGEWSLRSVEAVFSKPIRVGEEVSLAAKDDGKGGLRVELCCGGSVVTVLKLGLEPRADRNAAGLKACLPEATAPRAVPEEELEGTSGTLTLCLAAEAAARMFPHLMSCFSRTQLAVLLATSRLVGVFCPGLHSIYSELALAKGEPASGAELRYEVTDYDRRFGLVAMELAAPGLAGRIRAFLRPPPTQQESFTALKSRVEKDEFAGQRALVVGGSRGLGEVAAKLLAGGGAEVKITYHRGAEDCRRIVREIAEHGGAADCFSFDVLNPRLDPAHVSAGRWTPTHLYYFATPFIFAGVKGRFSPVLFAKFCDYYVGGFLATFDLLRASGTRHIFYPSTVAIDEIPPDMGEYAAAKSAGETLCAFLEKANPGLKIFRPPLPRMATDQTASVMPVANEDPVETILASLRTMQSA